MKQRRPYEQKVSPGAYEANDTKCIGPECQKRAVAHFMCNSHYYQKRNGKELAPLRKYDMTNRNGATQ